MGTFRSFTGFHYEIPDDDNVQLMIEELKHIRRTARRTKTTMVHFHLFVLKNADFFRTLNGEERAHFCEECGYGSHMPAEITKMLNLSDYISLRNAKC